MPLTGHAHIQAVLNSLSIFVAIFAPDGTVRFINEKPLRLVGLRLEDVVGRPLGLTSLWDHTPAERDKVRAAITSAASGRPQHVTIRVPVAGQDDLWVDVSFDPVLDESGAVREVVSMGIDVTARVQAEQRLRESEERLKRSQRIARLGSWELDPHTGTLAWSEEVYRIFERDPTTFGGSYDAFLQAVHPDDRALVDAAYAASVSQHIPYDVVHRLQMPDGRIKFVQEWGTTLYDDRDMPVRSVGTVQDVSEREFLERQSREALGLLTAVMDASPNWIYVKDASYRLTYVNRAFADGFGLAREQLLGSVAPASSPGAPQGDTSRERFRAADDAALAGQTVHLPNQPVVLPDGSVQIRDVIKLPVRRGDPVCAEVLTLAHDVSDRRRAEEALAARETLFRTVAEVAPVGIFRTDASGTTTYANQQYFALTGLAAHEVPGLDWFRAVHPDDRDGARRRWQQVSVDRLPFEAEVRLVRNGGAELAATLRVAPDLDQRGRILGLVGVVADISELKRAQARLADTNLSLERRVAERTAALQAANAELEAFSFSVSHDLKAPLRTIDGYSRLLLDSKTAFRDEEGRRFVQTIRDTVVRMSTIVDDLLSYSLLGQTEAPRQEIDVASLVEAAVRELADDIATHGTAVTVSLPREQAAGDCAGLAIALRNVIDNAVKFTRATPAPRIDVGGRNDATHWTLWVRDNGIGFDMRHHDRIFGLFQRLPDAGSSAGTGIGLALARKAMTRLGGRIWAESAPGEGATFFLTWPQ